VRTYIRTHPWISFKLNLRQADYKFWLTLGEAQAKCEYLAALPLQPETAKNLHQIYLAKGVLATTAIEGNTLSEEEVLELVKGKLRLPASKTYLAQETQNIIDACNLISKNLLTKTGGKALSVDRIKEFNRLVLKDLALDEDVIPGEIRKYSVGVGDYRGAPAQDCQYLLEQLCGFLQKEALQIPRKQEIAFGLIRAVLAHLYLAWIHPFGDGNGRTARLIEFQILLAAGVPTLAVHLLSNHYNLTRQEYYRQLSRASQSGGDVFPFIHYAVQGFSDGLDEQMKIIQNQILGVLWRDYVYTAFADKKGEAPKRQRELVLALSKREIAIPISGIPHLSLRLAEAYARRSKKTVARDIKTVIEMGLVLQTPEGLRVPMERMLALLPKRKQDI